MNLARPVLLPIIPPARHKFHPQVTAAGWAGADFEACKWSVRLSYLSARDIARLGPATQDTMVAHSIRNAKVFFGPRRRRKKPAYAAGELSRRAPLFCPNHGVRRK
jgi:hypothetical protein